MSEKIVHLNEEVIKGQLKELVRGSVEETLNGLLEEVKLHVPRLKGVTFETAIIERYRRRESSVEEALMEMYGAPRRRYHRSAMGLQGFFLNDQRTEQEGIRTHRTVEKPAT